MISIDAFTDYVANGGKVAATDPMPEEYRKAVLRMVQFQAVAELFGTPFYAEWLPMAPTMERKLILTAKMQDEIGHGHYTVRVCEDLGKSRAELIDDLFEGRAKLLNFFHYDVKSYEEWSAASFLGTTAAIVQFESLATGSYLPYARALKRIIKEESFHYHQGRYWFRLFASKGTPEQRARLQAGLDKWFPIILTYFGQPDSHLPKPKAMVWNLKVDFSDTLRNRWLSRLVPQLDEFGMRRPDPNLKQDADTGAWQYTAPQWDEVKRIVEQGGPRYADRIARQKELYQATKWVRDLLTDSDGRRIAD